MHTASHRGDEPADRWRRYLHDRTAKHVLVRGWPVGPGVTEVDLFNSAWFRPVPESPHGQRQQYHRGGNRVQEDEGAAPAVSHVDVLPPVQEDLGGGESNEGEDNRHSEGASGHRRSQGPAGGTAPETNQRQRAEDHEGKAAEKEQQEADVGDRRFLVGRGVVGKNLIERQADGSDAQHQQDPEKWRPPPHITSVCQASNSRSSASSVSRPTSRPIRSLPSVSTASTTTAAAIAKASRSCRW